ncbi:unnamed protein product [Phytophthora fragariaefolia]|uniref:Unnamed protein product n=1 Tax=Phytophthora fragariaefolia TaxID=1490495 RepID=A0A9W6WXT3_9STRA|nr:unnamed protein product [Phytophthora fragariaefolia]
MQRNSLTVLRSTFELFRNTAEYNCIQLELSALPPTISREGSAVPVPSSLPGFILQYPLNAKVSRLASSNKPSTGSNHKLVVSLRVLSHTFAGSDGEFLLQHFVKGGANESRFVLKVHHGAVSSVVAANHFSALSRMCWST